MSSGIRNWVELPSGWSWERLDRLFARSKESGQPELEPLSVYLDAGVVPRSSREDNHNPLGADLGKYLVVRPGDLVFNKLRTWQGGLGAASDTGIVSPAYFVCRPRDKVFPLFAHYLLRSSPYLAELTRLSKWRPPSQFDIGWRDLRTVPLLLPPTVEAQREIVAGIETSLAALDEALGVIGNVSDPTLGREARVQDRHSGTIAGLLYEKRRAIITSWVTGRSGEAS